MKSILWKLSECFSQFISLVSPHREELSWALLFLQFKCSSLQFLPFLHIFLNNILLVFFNIIVSYRRYSTVMVFSPKTVFVRFIHILWQLSFINFHYFYSFLLYEYMSVSLVILQVIESEVVCCRREVGKSLILIFFKGEVWAPACRNL